MNNHYIFLMKPFLCIALLGLLIAGCQPVFHPGITASPAGIASPTHQGSDQEETVVKIQYSSLSHTPQKIQKVNVPANILKTIPLTKGKLLVFADEEMLFYGYQDEPSGDFYKAGPIGAPVYLNEITSGEAHVFGKSLIWVKGLAGASTMITDILEIGNGTVSPFLHLDKDVLIEDVDHDKETELLTLAGNPFPVFTVIKWRDNGFYELDINQTLKAEQGVRYNPQSGSFTVSSPGHGTRTYRLETTGLHLNNN